MNFSKRCSAWLLALCCTGAWGQAPKNAPLELTPFVKTSCVKPTGGGLEAKMGSIGYMDLGKSNGGDLFLTRGKELWQWKQTSRGQRFLQVRGLPNPPASQGRVFQISRFRAGAYWATEGNRILRWDGIRNVWETALTAPVDFEEFEIGPDSSILLLTTPSNFIEVFEVGAEKPKKMVPYPEMEMDAADKAFTRRVWRNLKTNACDEHIVIYASDNGRLYDFDAYSHKLREASVPWDPLKTRGLARQAQAQGIILCNGFPSRDCIQIIPDLALSVKIAYTLKPFIVVKPGSRDPKAPSLPEIKYQEGADLSIRHFDWSLADNSKSEVQRDASLAFPLWLNGAGDLVPLDILLDKARERTASEPKNETKGKGSAESR